MPETPVPVGTGVFHGVSKSIGGGTMENSKCNGAQIALIVEDDPDLREVAAAVLQQTDLRIVTCEDSEEAFTMLCKHGNDIAFIFTDIHLPGVLDGVDLVHRVGALWPRVTVIVTSGEAGARRKSLPDGIVYMQKPWVAEDVLMQAWRATLRMQGHAGVGAVRPNAGRP